MIETQTELNINTKKPPVSSDEIKALESALQGRGWVFARTLQSELGLSDRKIRSIAESSDGAIISGQKGYRLLDASVPIEDVDHAASWLESQSRQMANRARAIRRRYHRYAKPVHH